MTMSVGILGFGTMGRPMGAHMRSRGYEVTVFDVNSGATEEAQRLGFSTSVSPRQLAEQVDVVFIVVGFDDEVRNAVYGPSGLLEGCHPGTVVVVSSTVAPTLMTELLDAFSQRDAFVADAPLIRGVQPAIDGTLLVTVGAENAVFERIRPLLDCFASDVVHIGGVGTGQVAKTLNNYLLWACHCANYEMFKVSDSFAIDRSAIKEALLLGSGANTPLSTWGTSAFGTFVWAEKDMSILLSVADCQPPRIRDHSTGVPATSKGPPAG